MSGVPPYRRTSYSGSTVSQQINTSTIYYGHKTYALSTDLAYFLHMREADYICNGSCIVPGRLGPQNEFKTKFCFLLVAILFRFPGNILIFTIYH